MNYITWTCCKCENQVEEQFMDTDERMCEDCIEEEDLDLPDKMVNDEFWRREVYLYLEQLRESGETNMFGAGVYLQKHFELSKEKAIMYLTDWMKQYNQGEDNEKINS